MTTFQESLQRGKVGESAIAQWLKEQGFSILPVYEIEKHQGKGPQVFSLGGELVAPDMLAFNNRNQVVIWVEAKHKTGFSWYRIASQWTTGIDLRHYGDYCKLADSSPWPVWLAFLHRGGQAKDSGVSPSGLFVQDLKYLRAHESHRSDRWGPSGMVYWSIDSLIKMGDADADGNIWELERSAIAAQRLAR